MVEADKLQTRLIDRWASSKEECWKGKLVVVVRWGHRLVHDEGDASTTGGTDRRWCSIQVVQDQHTWLYHHQGAATDGAVSRWCKISILGFITTRVQPQFSGTIYKKKYYVNLVVGNEIVDGSVFLVDPQYRLNWTTEEFLKMIPCWQVPEAAMCKYNITFDLFQYSNNKWFQKWKGAQFKGVFFAATELHPPDPLIGKTNFSPSFAIHLQEWRW